MTPLSTGYSHPLYAASFASTGTVRHLPRADTWIVERPIPGTPFRDAMSCYPLLTCRHWPHLKEDLEALGTDLISLSAVTDPFGTYDLDLLQQCFPDVCKPYKKHFIVDLQRPLTSFVHKSHQRNVRKAAQMVDVQRCPDPEALLEDWCRLYDILIAHHHITGLQVFSKEAFQQQLATPGLVAFQAMHQGEIVGMVLWYVSNGVGYYHLGAYNETGYATRASFALFWASFSTLAQDGLRWLALGAGAGLQGDKTDGLTRFKQGWATGQKQVYFCGKIFDPDRYAALVKQTHTQTAPFFPKYRDG